MSSFHPSAASQAQQVEYGSNKQLFDRSWENIQKKTFTNWINNKLKVKKIEPISNIDIDLCSGEKLIQVLEIIGDESLGRYSRNPKLRLQKIENMNIALAFIKRRGVNLTNIGAEDLTDGNVKLILGLIWSIILRFTIADISEEGLTAKEGLLLWVQKRTLPYSSVKDFYVKNFTDSWQDGLALCGLIHRHRPDLLNYWALDKTKRHENTALAFEIAERDLGIPKLFTVEDIVDVAKPDERSVMTYVAQYFHAFSSMDKLGNAGRRVGQFGQVVSQAWAMQNDYERRVKQLIFEIGQIQAQWNKSTFINYPDARRQLGEFEQYKSTVKRSWLTEKRDLDTLLGNIQLKLQTYKLARYTPPQGLTPFDLENVWVSQTKAEAERKKNISSYIREIKEVIKHKYANAANQLQNDLDQVSKNVKKLEGEPESQLNGLRQLILGLEPLKSNLGDVAHLNQDQITANIEDNEYTILNVDDLSFELETLTQSLLKKKAFLDNQIVARTISNVTPQQLESYTETFRHFDKSNSNDLSKDEFKAALQAEGNSLSDPEVDKVFAGSIRLTFQKFLDFMRSIEEDKTTPEQLEISFAALSLDKTHITEQDMYNGALPGPIVEYFKQAMPQANGDLHKVFGN